MAVGVRSWLPAVAVVVVSAVVMHRDSRSQLWKAAEGSRLRSYGLGQESTGSGCEARRKLP
jgi:hypothetical protein